MQDENAIVRHNLMTIRRELDKRRIPLKVCAADAEVSYSTFLSWFPADGTPQIPSLAFLPSLARALPGDLLDMLVPDGFYIMPAPAGLDHDDLAAGCREYLNVKDEAHHPESPEGREISDCERKRLEAKIVPLRGKVA